MYIFIILYVYLNLLVYIRIRIYEVSRGADADKKTRSTFAPKTSWKLQGKEREKGARTEKGKTFLNKTKRSKSNKSEYEKIR